MANTVLPMPRHVEIAYKDPLAVLGSMKRISATCGVAEKARIGRVLFRSDDDPLAAKQATPLSETSCRSSG